MDGIVLPGDQRSDQLREQAIALQGRPAFVARAQRAVLATQLLLRECRQKREELLMIARIRLGILQAQAGDWETLCELLQLQGKEEVFENLEQELAPELRVTVQRTTSRRKLERALHQFRVSLRRFNQRWPGFLAEVDRSKVNELREKHNRYYVLEKECATRSYLAAIAEFVPMPPLTLEDLIAELPLLTVP